MIMLNAIWLWLVSTASGVPVEYQVNAREGCRQIVAGAYVQAYDERERTLAYVATLKEQLSALKTASIKAKQELSTIESALAKQNYDIDKASKLDMAAANARAVLDQTVEYQKMLNEAEKAVIPARQREQDIKRQFGKVFEIEMVKDNGKGGYPFRVVYRTACPKYRALCPLPADQQDELQALRIDGTLPEPCRKYVGQSKI
ncbi:MAG: hypothetical protein FJ146_06445 [Deltaproteobacteria bacterium]|nr:hypothetical protein [Deltaproteobacteria bacterium]